MILPNLCFFYLSTSYSPAIKLRFLYSKNKPTHYLQYPGESLLYFMCINQNCTQYSKYSLTNFFASEPRGSNSYTPCLDLWRQIYQIPLLLPYPPSSPLSENYALAPQGPATIQQQYSYHFLYFLPGFDIPKYITTFFWFQSTNSPPNFPCDLCPAVFLNNLHYPLSATTNFCIICKLVNQNLHSHPSHLNILQAKVTAPIPAVHYLLEISCQRNTHPARPSTSHHLTNFGSSLPTLLKGFSGINDKLPPER